MQDADKGQSGTLDGQGLTIGIVRARFNDAITSKLAECCLAELAACGVRAEDIQQLTVPGAWRCRWPCRPWPTATTTTR
jgi:6,7-dimethyl-8-ribityllumazine synthase